MKTNKEGVPSSTTSSNPSIPYNSGNIEWKPQGLIRPSVNLPDLVKRIDDNNSKLADSLNAKMPNYISIAEGIIADEKASPALRLSSIKLMVALSQQLNTEMKELAKTPPPSKDVSPTNTPTPSGVFPSGVFPSGGGIHSGVPSSGESKEDALDAFSDMLGDIS